jgi:hypothetical protein
VEMNPLVVVLESCSLLHRVRYPTFSSGELTSLSLDCSSWT